MKKNILKSIMLTTILGIACLAFFTVELRAQAPGTWNGLTTIPPSPTLNSTFSLDNAIGIGIGSPRAWQEIKFCPPVSGPANPGLIVTYDNTCVQYFPAFIPGNEDVIGFPGIGNPPEPNQILFPYSFLTGHHTNVLQPLYQPNKSPLFWARVQNSAGPFSYSGPQEYDTKMIVQPDGSVGINIADPRAALDVRGSQGVNRPVAILGSRAIGTGSSAPNGLFQYYTQQVHFVPVLSNNGYNRISMANDQGMFFSDGKGTDGSNLNGAFILAPWAQEGDASLVGGMRMDKFGNVEFHGNVRATKMKVEAKWWSDFVFDEDYKLMSLKDLEAFIKTNKHLPNVPNEATVLKNGLDISEMQAIQQQKIEELTLYIIQQQKQVDELKATLESLKSE